MKETTQNIFEEEKTKNFDALLLNHVVEFKHVTFETEKVL